MTWQTKKLGEICVVDWGNTNLTKKSYINNGKYLACSAAGCDGRINHKEHQKYTPVLSAIGAQCGKMFFPEEDFTAIKNTITLTPKKEIVDNKFLFLLFNYIDLPRRGAGQPFISKGDIEEFKILLPSLSEQQRIAKILDEVFMNVAKAKENAEKNLQNSKELFESYLQGVFANPGKDWEEKRLGDVCDFVRGPFGGSLKKSIFKKEGYIVYEQQHAIYDQFTKIRYFIDENKFNEMKRFELKSGDLIMSCSGTMGKIAIAPEGIKRGIINQALLKLSPSKNLLNVFLKYWIESGVFQDDLKTYTKGAAIKNVVSVKILKGIKMFIPKIQKQKSIVAKLDALSGETKKLEAIYRQKLMDLEELKKSVLKKAFAGELVEEKNTVPVAQAVAPSPYMRNQVHAAIINQVVGDGGSTSEVAVAKYDHLLQEIFGLSLGYQFQTQQFGPFDAQIKRLLYSGLGPNKWFTKRGGMIVFGNNINALLSRQSNLYRSSQSAMKELARLNITKLDTDKVELLSTICHSIKETKSILFDKVRDFMSKWPTDKDRTKADKFSSKQTQACLDFIVNNNLHLKLLK